MQENKCVILDTNIIIRFLAQDSSQQAEAVEKLFKNAPEKSLFIPDIVLVEAVYVLLSYYGLTKKETIERITSLIFFKKFKLNTRLFQKTLEVYTQHALSFVDAYILALSSLDDMVVYTFDKKLLVVSRGQASLP